MGGSRGRGAKPLISHRRRKVSDVLNVQQVLNESVPRVNFLNGKRWNIV
jgi:hypothetical protein